MSKAQKQKIAQIAIAAVIFVIAHFLPAEDHIRLAGYLVAYFIVGFEVLKDAFLNLFRGQVFDENLLMSIATIGAFAIGQYPEGVFVMLFAQVGEFFEHYAVNRSRESISEMMNIQPESANVYREGKLMTVDPEDVQIDEVILIAPGEKVPLDGVIIDGTSSLETKALTGEAMPQSVNVGDQVLSGCINQGGTLKVKVTKLYSDSTVAKILELVENAASQKAPTERFITKFARYYTPAVVIAALALAFVPPLILGFDVFSEWFRRALIFLVISCPCALVISIPLGFFSGIGAAAREGILVKGSNYLEVLAKCETAVFDKTGTLTEGHPTATGWLWAQPQEEHFKDVLLAAELKSEHPLAGAIVAVLQDEEKITPAPLSSFESITGKGIKVSYQGKTYWVGSHKLLKDFSATVSDVMADMLVHYESDGNGIIYFGRENELLAIIAVSDPIKATSAEAVKELKRQGIDICMLTGDGQRTALAVSSRLGIERFVADALPDDKAEFVRELQMQGKKVAMVGDGINDSQALALADVSIAMGKGTDIAMDVAMVTLMTSDLLLLPKAFELSRQTVRLIHQNLFWAFIYNLIGIPIAAGVLFPINGLLLNPMLASAAMAFSSVSVVLNSLSLGRRKI